MSDATAETAAATRPVIPLFAIYRVFFWIGVFSFGGGLVPWMQREIVTTRGWMKNEDFVPGVALAQVLPGVNSTNLAVFIGQHLRGLAGVIAALGGMLTGPFLIMLAATAVYHQILEIKPLQIAMTGVAAAAIGMILRTGLSAVQLSLTSGIVSIVIMLATFVMIGVLKWPLLWVVAIMTPLSIALAWPRGKKEDGSA
jgi:chromate transporter